MSALFLRMLNMSITAGWIALAVMLLRPVLRKAPKALRVVMWAFVGIRLMFPFSFESALSLIPSTETVPPEILYTDAPVIESGIPILNETVNPILTDKFASTVDVAVSPMKMIAEVAACIWIVGMVFMALYALGSYLGIYRKVREAVLPEEPIRLCDHASTYSADRIRLCDHIATPFILGVLRPRIYLPSTMNDRDMGYVIAHEAAHLKRRDHWWKPLGFLLLTVHWFNPLLWVAYVLFCRDIELACDEKVIRELGEESKKSYSDALINCSIPRRMIAACPLAFGEVGVKTRIKSVLNYKKPAFWIVGLSMIACIVAAVCLLSDPPGEHDDQVVADIPVEIPEGLVKYEFKGSVDPLPPTVCLNISSIEEEMFSFSYSAFSSYWPVGNYEVEGNHLTLRADDSRHVYVFKVEGDTLIFDASKSSEIVGLWFNREFYGTECPVPDGAVFERVPISEKTEALKEPPNLQLCFMGKWEETSIGDYAWRCGDRTMKHDLSGPRVFDYMDYMASIEWDPEYYGITSSIVPDQVSLHFEVMPDEVAVIAWSKSGIDAVSQTVELTENLTFSASEFPADVYDVVARWNSSEYYRGEVHYGFRIVNPLSDEIPLS